MSKNFHKQTHVFLLLKTKVLLKQMVLPPVNNS